MGPDTVCKTVHQYNQVPIPKEDMAKLLEIGADYQKVNPLWGKRQSCKDLSRIHGTK